MNMLRTFSPVQFSSVRFRFRFGSLGMLWFCCVMMFGAAAGMVLRDRDRASSGLSARILQRDCGSDERSRRLRGSDETSVTVGCSRGRWSADVLCSAAVVAFEVRAAEFWVLLGRLLLAAARW